MSPPPTDPNPIPKSGGTFFGDRSSWGHLQRRRKACPLCNLSTLGNILMILNRNVEQDIKRIITLAFLLLELFPFVLFEVDFVSAL